MATSLQQALGQVCRAILNDYRAGSLRRLIADLILTRLMEHVAAGEFDRPALFDRALLRTAALDRIGDDTLKENKKKLPADDYRFAETPGSSSVPKAITQLRRRLPWSGMFVLDDGKSHEVIVLGLGLLWDPDNPLAELSEDFACDATERELGVACVVLPPLITDRADSEIASGRPDDAAQTLSPIVELPSPNVYIHRERSLTEDLGIDAFVRREQGIRLIAEIYEQHLGSRFQQKETPAEPYPITYLFDDAFEDGEQYDAVFIPALFDWNLRVARLIERHSHPGDPVIRRLLPIPRKRADDNIDFMKFAISYHLIFGTALHTIFVRARSSFLQTEFGTDGSSFTLGELFIEMDQMYERNGQLLPKPRTDRQKVTEFFTRIKRLGRHAHLLRYNARTFTHAVDANLEEMWAPFLSDLQHQRCAECGKKLDPGILDHIVPLPAGNNSLVNLRMLCRGGEHGPITELPRIDLTRIVQRRKLTDLLLERSLELLKKLTDRTLVGVPIGPGWPDAVRKQIG
jgi:hypothetical protein